LEDGSLLSAPSDAEKTLVLHRQPIHTSPPRKTYEFSRLCFKKAIIEPLSPSDEFRIITPVGTFQMSKADFYEAFPNVVKSRSYQEDGIYHYVKVLEKAKRFMLTL
jgi:hypothetical protein